jgi:thioredoxin-dependent peroxiredoxin
VSATKPAVGDLAPDFTAPLDDGSMLTLSRLRGRRVVLFFYPKDGTPG